MPTDTIDTIVAISTALAPGLRGIIRLSGPRAFPIARILLGPSSPEPLPQKNSHTQGQLQIADWNTTVETTVYWMQGPRSYTGEDLVELHTFSALPLLHKLVAQTITAGARPAQPGEFTRRAFLSGRMDLAQVEAVQALICATTEAERRQAMLGMHGELSQRLKNAADAIKEVLALLEAYIDFAEDEVGQAPLVELSQKLAQATAVLEKLLETTPAGRSQITVCLFGLPNAGKSSLLNALTGKPLALTSAIPGTTRDYLLGELTLAGTLFQIIDIPGIMENPQAIQHKAQERARTIIQSADLILYLVDGSKMPDDLHLPLIANLPNVPVLLVKTKADLPAVWSWETWQPLPHSPTLELSIYERASIENIEAWLIAHAQATGNVQEPTLLSMRQQYAAQEAHRALHEALTGLVGGVSYEFIALDLRSALSFLGELVGTITTEELLDHIFSTFCIGK